MNEKDVVDIYGFYKDDDLDLQVVVNVLKCHEEAILDLATQNVLLREQLHKLTALLAVEMNKKKDC